MRLFEIKEILKEAKEIKFALPTGTLVPAHFHVTEVGKVTKDFIDCGGTLRKEKVVNFQFWSANDYDHRLHPEKLLHIIELSQAKLGIEDELEIEVEYQGETIGKYGLDFDGNSFRLTSKQTDCLAKSTCAPPAFQQLEVASSNTCSPGGGCC